ncbi:MAG: hypothetical protein RI930_378 [Pseudomonadota bacterium]|jgi:hypothetical protein
MKNIKNLTQFTIKQRNLLKKKIVKEEICFQLSPHKNKTKKGKEIPKERIKKCFQIFRDVNQYSIFYVMKKYNLSFSLTVSSCMTAKRILQNSYAKKAEYILKKNILVDKQNFK